MISRLRRQRGAMLGLVLFMLLVLAAIAASVLTTANPIYVDVSAAFQPPSIEHPMGTDNLGRSIFARFLYGARISLTMGVIAVALGSTVGITLGITAGFYGKWVDAFLSWFVEVLLAFPGILLALSVVAILGPGLSNAMIAVGVAFTPSFMRLARSTVLVAREQDYILAARALGVPNWRIMVRHILPNILRPLLVLTTLGMGNAILEGAALSFLGLGAQPPTPEWGSMLSTGRSFMRQGWWITVFPGLGIFLVVLSVNLFGDGLGDALDYDARSQHQVETEN